MSGMSHRWYVKFDPSDGDLLQNGGVVMDLCPGMGDGRGEGGLKLMGVSRPTSPN